MKYLTSLVLFASWAAGVILGWIYAWWLGLVAFFFPPVAHFILIYNLLQNYGLI